MKSATRGALKAVMFLGSYMTWLMLNKAFDTTLAMKFGSQLIFTVISGKSAIDSKEANPTMTFTTGEGTPISAADIASIIA